MKKIICLVSAAALLFLCGCKNVAEYSSDPVDLTGSYYTTSIVGTFESEESRSSDTENVSSLVSSSTVSKTEKPQKVSSDSPSAQSSSSKPKESSSSKQSSTVTSSASQPYTPSGSITYYYYDRLSDGQKVLYNTISKAINDMQEGLIELGSCSDEDVTLAFNAVRTDHPEYFWIPISYITKIDGNSRFIAFDYKDDKYSVSYACSREERNRMQAALNAKISKIRSEVFKNKMGIYELELALHDWICNNVTYVTTGELVNTAYGALVNGKALCEGYSRAMQILCYEFKIPCTLVCGKATDPKTKETESHMWNVIQLDKEWYNVDATWDDDDDHGIALHNYFNVTDKQISETHTAAPDFKDISSEAIKGGSFNFYLPKCTATKHYFVNNEGCLLTDDNSASRTVIMDVLKKTTGKRKNYCEFYLSFGLDNSVTAESIAKSFSLLDSINMVNSSSANKIDTSKVGVALSGQTFIVFFEYEVE